LTVTFYLFFLLFICYIKDMTITQTVDIPGIPQSGAQDRRITIPREVPAGATIITFTPASIVKRKNTEAEEIELINRHADELNKEAMDVLSYQWPGFSEEKLREMESINRQAKELNKELDL
jgi:ABC-type multidrug transport system fused ATPase/permease subunit